MSGYSDLVKCSTFDCYRLSDFSDEEEDEDLDDELPDPLLFEALLPLEDELPDLADDELPEEPPVFPVDLEREPVEKDCFPEL